MNKKKVKIKERGERREGGGNGKDQGQKGNICIISRGNGEGLAVENGREITLII